jgi:hypothetical protein
MTAHASLNVYKTREVSGIVQIRILTFFER